MIVGLRAYHFHPLNNPRLLALTTVLIWSFGGYTTRLIALRPYNLLLAIALTSTTMMFGSYLLLSKQRTPISLLRGIKLKYLALGFIGYGFFYLTNVQSTLHFGNISETMVLGSTWPLFTVLFTYLLFQTNHNTPHSTQIVQVFGMSIGFFAIVILATQGQPQTLRISNGPGIMFALVAGSSYGLYSALSSQIDGENTVDFLFQAVLISAIVMWAFSLPDIQELPRLTPSDYTIAAFKGLAINGIGYFTWMRANQLAYERGLDVSAISSIMFILPLLGLTIVAVFLGERYIFQPYFLGSLAMILTSSLVCQRPEVFTRVAGRWRAAFRKPA